MPIKQEVQRLYRIEDANLITTAEAKILFMKRDIVKLNEFGITDVLLDEFQLLVKDFEKFSTDLELLGFQAQATEKKNAMAATLRDALEQVRVRVETKYGYASAKYRTFGIGEISRWDDANLLITGRRVARMATAYLADLVSVGLSAAIITELENICDLFEKSILIQNEKIGERDIVQEDRVEMGNAIFIQMKDYCRLAKAAWRTLDAAKYNDYLVYDTPSGSGTGNDTSIDNEYVATVDANTVKTVAAIDEEVVLIMTNTGSVPLIFCLSETDAVSGITVVVPVGSTITKTSTEMDPDSVASYLLVKNESTSTQGSYIVQVEM